MSAVATEDLWRGGKTHRVRLYVKWCRGSTVNPVSCDTKTVPLVEKAEPLSPPFEVNQAQLLLRCFSLEPGCVLSDVRLLSSLEAIVEPCRGESFWEGGPLFPPSAATQSVGFKR